MIHFLRNIFSFSPKNPIPINVLSLEHFEETLSKRESELQSRIQAIYQKMAMGIQDIQLVKSRTIQLILDRNIIPQGPPSASGNSIKVHFLFLFSPSEFPQALRVEGPDDPKLNNDTYWNQLSKWLSELTGNSEKSMTWEDKQMFKLYLRFKQNPELAARAFDFILHHETAHILHDHNSLPKTDMHSKRVLLLLLSAACLSKISNYFAVLIDRATSRMATKRTEWEADRTAIHTTRDLEGPIYLFQTMQNQQKQSRNDPQATRLAKLFITQRGDFIPFICSHQLESNRIASLKAEFAKNIEGKVKNWEGDKPDSVASHHSSTAVC